MEMILIHAPYCHLYCKPSQVENAFHIPISINLSNCLLKMGRLYFLCWLNRMLTRFRQWKQKMMEKKKNQTLHICLLLDENEFLNLKWSQIYYNKLYHFFLELHNSSYTLWFISISSRPLSIFWILNVMYDIVSKSFKAIFHLPSNYILWHHMANLSVNQRGFICIKYVFPDWLDPGL